MTQDCRIGLSICGLMDSQPQHYIYIHHTRFSKSGEDVAYTDKCQFANNTTSVKHTYTRDYLSPPS